MEILKALIESPVANLFMVAGLVFLGIAVVGDITGKIQPGKTGRILSGLLGIVLMSMGLMMYSRQPPTGPAVPTNVPVVDVKIAAIESSPTFSPTLFPAGFRVIETFLRADPFDFSGACPVMITFSGRISVAGGGGTVSYKWIRNDGASAPVETLTFDGPSSKEVNTTWYIGASGMTYSGWQAIEIFDPQSLTSEHADFKIQCD